MRKITCILALFMTLCTPLVAQENLIEGGDFDRANWQDYSKPALWSFEGVKVNHLEAPSYVGNQGYCYIEITPKSNGKMRLFKEGYDMLPDYAAFSVSAGTQLKVEFWAKSESENTIQISIPWYDTDRVSNKAWTSADISLKGGVWKKYTVYTAVAPEGITQAGLTTLFTSEGGTLSFDDFAVYQADGTQPEGTVVVALEDGTIEGDTEPQPQPELTNLMTGGDFDRANWQDYSKPDLWTFENVKVNHLEAPSYEGNQGYCYIEITPQVGGTMSNYKEGDDMKPDYASLEVKGLQQLQVVFWAKSASANTIQLSVPWYDAQGSVISTWTSADIKLEGGVWKKYIVYTEKLPEGTVKAGVSTHFTSAEGNIAFDDFAAYAADGTKAAGTVVVELEDGSKEPGSGDGDTPADGNLFEYGDFEQINPKNQKPMGWYLPNSAYFKMEKDDLPAGTQGKQALCIFPNTDVRLVTNYEGKEDILAIEEGRTYRLLFYAKAKSKLDKTSVRLQFYANGEPSGTPLYVAEDVSFSSEWELYAYEFKAPYEVNSASCTISFSTDNDFVYFDDIELYVLPDQGVDEVTPIAGIVRVDNLFYLLDGDHAIVSPEADDEGINYNEANRPTGDIVIPANIEVEGVTYPVTHIAASTFAECPGVTSVEMPESITKIGNYAFEYCDALETVTFANSLTEIGYYAFYQCAALRSVNLPAGLKSIGDNAFGECTGLETFEMNSKEPASITTGKDIFFNVDRSKVVLRVPVGYEDVYANLYPWSSFMKIETGVQSLATDRVEVLIAQGQLSLKAQLPVSVMIHDLAGRQVYAGRMTQGVIGLDKGLYVLTLDQQSRKVMIP